MSISGIDQQLKKKCCSSFIAKYPDSKHRGELEAKIDEIDWAGAVAKNNENAYLGIRRSIRMVFIVRKPMRS